MDSETAQRKLLANETEKVLAEFSFRTPRSTGTASAWSQIATAFRQSGSVLADSTAAVITTIVAIIPWLILILPGLWLARRIWRKLRRNPPVGPTSTAII